MARLEAQTKSKQYLDIEGFLVDNSSSEVPDLILLTGDIIILSLSLRSSSSKISYLKETFPKVLKKKLLSFEDR